MSDKYSEWSGGSFVQHQCDKCGRFVKLPKTYRPRPKRLPDGSLIENGAWGRSRCTRCRKWVMLPVEFL